MGSTQGRGIGRWLISMITVIVAITIVAAHASFANDRSNSQPLPIALQIALQRIPTTHTLLSDGRTLTLEDSKLVLETQKAGIVHSAATVQYLELPKGRRFATATVMPDGRVLIWGGADAAGSMVNAGLWFDPITNSLAAAEDVTLSARIGQTATLLSDGRLLMTGGWSSALGSMQGAEIYDPRTGHSQQAIANSQTPPRIGQSANLMSDGRVALVDGVDLDGKAIATTTTFDPVTMQLSVAPAKTLINAVGGMEAPVLMASSPALDATDFPADGVLALRFSAPMDVRSINAKTITLLGPGGITRAKVVGAEGGKLVFVTPESDLFPGAHYTLFLQGVMSAHGIGLPFAAIDFAVATQKATTPNSQSSSHTMNGSAVPTYPGGKIAVVGASSASSLTNTTETSGPATSSLPPLHLMAGVTGHDASKAGPCGVLGASIKVLCRTKSYTDQGAWYPGQDVVGETRSSHWRLNKPDITPQEVAYAALMLRVKGGSSPTGISGRIELIDGQVIANVDVSIGTIHVRTDANGRFTLTNVHAGHQWLYVDGTTANSAGHEYGQFIVGVDLRPGVTLPLGYRMYLPRILDRDKIKLPSPTLQDIVITHPEMPGLEIHIPAGTVIKDHKGKVVTELAIVPTPVDRAPFPTAKNFPVYFSIEPAGATVQNINPKGKQGIQIVYPNYDHLAPGTQADFYVYHPDDNWKVYGKGHVNTSGTQIVPEAGVNLVWVMGGSFYIGNAHPGDSPQTKECGACSGDPVDLWSGTLEESQVDVRINDVIPISLARLFHLNSLRNETRAFGGWRSNYDMYVYSSNGDFTKPSVRLPDGNLLAFTQTVAGPQDEYKWTYAGSPSPWYGATLEAVALFGSNFNVRCEGANECYLLTLKDGTQFQFDDTPDTPLAFIRDRFGNQVTLTYNGGLLQQITSPSGRFISLTYNSDNNIATATDNTGRTWSYGYTVQPNPVLPAQPWYSLDSVTYPDLTAWHYTYQTNSAAGDWGALVSVVDRNGHNVVTNSYGQLPNGGGTFAVTNQTLADNTSYTFAHTAPVQGSSEMDVTDPNGHIRKVIMDAASGYPVSITEAAGTAQERTMTYVRDGNGLINSMTDALLRKTTYTYDAEGNVTSITRLAGTPNAVTQQFTYTPDYSQIATYSDGLAHTTTFTYTNGCLTSVKDPLGHTTTIVCSATGQPLSVKDALGHTTTFSYQSYDLRSVTNALNHTTTYTTDPLGRLSAVSDPLSNLSLRQYDVNDRVVKLVDPMNQITTLVNDAMGNVTSVTLPNTGTIGYLYDVRNRLIKRTDALTQFESWTPDGMGNVLSYTDRKGQSTTYQYDALDRRILTSYADSSTIVPTYDAADRVTALSDSVSGNQSFGYDGLDQLTQAVNPQATVAYTYDAAGRRKTMVAGTQASVGYTFDNANRITSLTQGSETVGLSYDNANRRNLLTLPNSVTVAYAYDNANQLTGITYKQGSGTVIGNLGYGYDNGGRRATQTGTLASDTLPTATTQSSTFDFNNRLTAFNGKTQTYDADGNLTGDGTNTYVWNARNQLVQVKQGTLVVATYAYDALGRRLSKAVNGGTATTLLYDGLNTVQETQGATITPILTGLGIDERYARTEPSGRTYFLTDALSSTIGLTDTSGNLVQRYQYDPYGEVTAQNSGFSNPYQYVGRENDGNGLYYYRARYYNPLMKRFVAEDPVGFGGGQSNFYAYVGNNPLSYADPLGLVEWKGTFNTKSLVVGVGFSVTNFDLTSECVDGKTFNAKVIMVGPAGGLGFKALSFLAAAQEDGTISFHDNSETIDPSRLEGGAGAISIGATVGKLSIEPGRIRIGHAFSDDVKATGLNIGAGLTLGSSTIVGGNGWTSCDCKN